VLISNGSSSVWQAESELLCTYGMGEVH